MFSELRHVQPDEHAALERDCVRSLASVATSTAMVPATAQGSQPQLVSAMNEYATPCLARAGAYVGTFEIVLWMSDLWGRGDVPF